jgi:hypothetical protein
MLGTIQHLNKKQLGFIDDSINILIKIIKLFCYAVAD